MWLEQDEIILLIFQYLVSDELFARLSLVSKKFYRISQDESLWRHRINQLSVGSTSLDGSVEAMRLVTKEIAYNIIVLVAEQQSLNFFDELLNHYNKVFSVLCGYKPAVVAEAIINIARKRFGNDQTFINGFLNSTGNFGQTLMHFFAVTHDSDAIELLILAGADINMKDFKFGLTPLQLIFTNKDFFIDARWVRILLDYGNNSLLTNIKWNSILKILNKENINDLKIQQVFALLYVNGLFSEIDLPASLQVNNNSSATTFRKFVENYMDDYAEGLIENPKQRFKNSDAKVAISFIYNPIYTFFYLKKSVRKIALEVINLVNNCCLEKMMIKFSNRCVWNDILETYDRILLIYFREFSKILSEHRPVVIANEILNIANEQCNGIEEIKQFLNKPGPSKQTYLHFFGAIRDRASIELLMSAGADPNLKESLGYTPLHLMFCRYERVMQQSSDDQAIALLTIDWIKFLLLHGAGFGPRYDGSLNSIALCIYNYIEYTHEDDITKKQQLLEVMAFLCAIGQFSQIEENSFIFKLNHLDKKDQILYQEYKKKFLMTEVGENQPNFLIHSII